MRSKFSWRSGIVATAASFLLVIALGELFGPRNVGAQNAGNAGTQTLSQKVVYTGSGPYISQIFNNIGQSAHYLSICPSLSSFAGTVDLEASYDGVTNWTPIAIANYQIIPLGSCIVLQAGGYYQNLRSTVNVNSGFVTAVYNATSGPIALAATGIGSIGPRAPIVCDLSTTQVVPSATTQSIITGVAAEYIRVCAYHISGQSAASVGFLQFQQGLSTSTCGGLGLWTIYTATATPLNYSLGAGQGQLFYSVPNEAMCLQNSSGESVSVSVSFAQTPFGF